MMDTAIWGYLHDGSLDRADGSVPGDISLYVSIPYLRAAFQPAGDGFVVELKKCTRFSLEDHRGAVVTDPGQIAGQAPEILSAENDGPLLAIYTTLGTLTLAYEAVEVSLDTGQPLTVPQLEQSSSEYWQRWSQRHGGSA